MNMVTNVTPKGFLSVNPRLFPVMEAFKQGMFYKLQV